MKTNLSLLSAALLALAAPAHSQTLLNLAFEGDTVSTTSRGTGTTSLAGAPGTFVDLTSPYAAFQPTAVGEIGRNVISSSDNPLGTGKALRVFDNSGATSAIASQAQSFTMSLSSASPTIEISFLYRGGPSLVANSGNTFLRMAWGGASMNASSSTPSSTGNFGRITFSSVSNTNGFSAANTMTDVAQVDPSESANNHVRLFINRTASSITYLNPSSAIGTLAANSYHVWLNGVQYTSGAAVAGGNFSMHASSTDVSTIGFGGGGGQFGGDWVIDNITVNVIPEPSSAMFLGLSSLLFLARRTRRP